MKTELDAEQIVEEMQRKVQYFYEINYMDEPEIWLPSTMMDTLRRSIPNGGIEGDITAYVFKSAPTTSIVRYYGNTIQVHAKGRLAEKVKDMELVIKEHWRPS